MTKVNWEALAIVSPRVKEALAAWKEFMDKHGTPIPMPIKEEADNPILVEVKGDDSGR